MAKTVVIETTPNGGATIEVTTSNGQPHIAGYSKNQLHTRIDDNEIRLVTVGDEQVAFQFDPEEDTVTLDGVALPPTLQGMFEALEVVFFRGSGTSGEITTETDALALAAINGIGVETWNAGVAFTTTNGVTVDPGDQYLQFDNGTTWADPPATVSGSFGNQQSITQVFDGAMIDAAPPWEGLVVVGDQATNVIPTGVDLSEVDEVRVTFGRTNQTWGKITVPFDPSEIDLDKLQGTLLPHFGDTYLSIANMDAAQFEAGDIPFRAVTGQGTFGFEISRIQFKNRVSVESPIIEVQNTGTIVTTGTFQNLGDSNPLFTGEDFSRLHLEYGDGTRDQFTFVNGLAKEERKGFETYEIEARVVNGQIQIRDLGTQSGISKAWYAHPPGVTRIPAATVNDTTAQGYQDIPGTNLRIQWGESAAGPVTYPMPFAAPTLPAFGTTTTDGESRSASASSHTATGFDLVNHVDGTNVDSALPVKWQAIGLKP